MQFYKNAIAIRSCWNHAVTFCVLCYYLFASKPWVKLRKVWIASLTPAELELHSFDLTPQRQASTKGLLYFAFRYVNLQTENGTVVPKPPQHRQDDQQAA